MPRSTLRVVLVLVVISLAILVPVILSGYSELEKAKTSTSYQDVAKHYKNAGQRLPWRADLYELSGHAYYYAKEYEQADTVYQKAFQHRALSPDGWVAWGDVLYLNGDPEAATQIWQDALQERNPSEKLFSRLSQVYKENGDYSRAAEYLQKYVALHSDDASAHYRLGLLLTLTDPDEALSELISASQLDPQLGPAVETLRSALNLASLNDSASERSVLTGRGLALVQEWELARFAFESAIAADQENAEAWAWLGEAKHQAGAALSAAGPASGGDEALSKGEDGAADLERAYQLNPSSSTVRGLRGLYFQRTGNFREALIEFQTAAVLDDKNPAWQVSVGETYSKLGDLIRALQAYQTATTLAPDDSNYWRLLAIFCGQNNVNVKDVGIPAAQKLVLLTKDDASALDILGWLLLLDKRYEEAERQLVHALARDPQNASAHLHLGMLYLEREQRDLAYSQFINARDLGSGDAEAILNTYFP